jgi:mono/diheme cytochrome c family protein
VSPRSRRAGWALLTVIALGGVAAMARTGAGASEKARDPSRVPPQQAPARFSFGRPADSARIKAWDIDVRPDGRGLPPGSGTVAQGATVYAARCASCHGANGTGGNADDLVGLEPWGEWPVNAAVGNYWPYATTLYDYIVRAMPQDKPGTLTANETYAVIAWILNQNKLVPDNAVMNATTLPQVQMPAKDRFVPDDRTGGPVVR